MNILLGVLVKHTIGSYFLWMQSTELIASDGVNALLIVITLYTNYHFYNFIDH